MIGFVYLIRSLKTGKYYFGSTNNLSRRFRQHNNGLSPSTRLQRPWKLIAQKEYPDILLARKIEQKMKAWKVKINNQNFLEILKRIEDNMGM